MRVRSVLRYWWLVLLVTVAAAGGAIGVTSTTTPLYEARGTYVIGPSDALEEPETIVRSFDSLQGQGIVPTLVELLSSRTIATTVGTLVGLDPAEVERYEVRASVLSSSNTLELVVIGPDAEATRRLADGIGREASNRFEGLYSVYQIVPLDVPRLPEEPTSPDPVRNLALGILLGLTVGTVLAVLLARAREGRVGDPRELRSGASRRRGRTPRSRGPLPPDPVRGPARPVAATPRGATGE